MLGEDEPVRAESFEADYNLMHVKDLRACSKAALATGFAVGTSSTTPSAINKLEIVVNSRQASQWDLLLRTAQGIRASVTSHATTGVVRRHNNWASWSSWNSSSTSQTGAKCALASGTTVIGRGTARAKLASHDNTESG
jgi:hypothetical protein